MGPVNVYLKLFIFKNILPKIEKAVDTFSVPEKIFHKMINYCVSLVHTLVKSLLNMLYIWYISQVC